MTNKVACPKCKNEVDYEELRPVTVGEECHGHEKHEFHTVHCSVTMELQCKKCREGVDHETNND